MPYKDKEEMKRYQREWYRLRKAGLKTTVKNGGKTKAKNHREHLDTQSKWQRKRRVERKQKLVTVFGDKCFLCDSQSRVVVHRKDGQPHKKWEYMNNKEFENELSKTKNEYVSLCYFCHKGIHWIMRFTKFKQWEEIIEIVIRP